MERSREQAPKKTSNVLQQWCDITWVTRKCDIQTENGTPHFCCIHRHYNTTLHFLVGVDDGYHPLHVPAPPRHLQPHGKHHWASPLTYKGRIDHLLQWWHANTNTNSMADCCVVSFSNLWFCEILWESPYVCRSWEFVSWSTMHCRSSPWVAWCHGAIGLPIISWSTTHCQSCFGGKDKTFYLEDYDSLGRMMSHGSSC